MQGLKNMKCFDYHKEKRKFCQKTDCRYWIEKENSQNCCINAAKDSGNTTLEEIGYIFKVTRMRICQIEKKAISKIKSIIAKK